MIFIRFITFIFISLHFLGFRVRSQLLGLRSLINRILLLCSLLVLNDTGQLDLIAIVRSLDVTHDGLIAFTLAIDNRRLASSVAEELIRVYCGDLYRLLMLLRCSFVGSR